MTKLPLYFGYAGTLPFIFFAFSYFFIEDHKMITFFQMGYGAMITSFLGGVHWGQAIPSGNKIQMSFAMVPTLVSFALMGWGYFIDPVTPLFILAILFWSIFIADLKLMPSEFIPEGYYVFRRNLTIIVSATLIVSGIFIVLG